MEVEKIGSEIKLKKEGGVGECVLKFVFILLWLAIN